MTAEMAKLELTQAEAAVRNRLGTDAEVPFPEVVESVRQDTALDEATVKAALLRLSSEGVVEITPDWIVRMVKPAEEAA